MPRAIEPRANRFHSLLSLRLSQNSSGPDFLFEKEPLLLDSERKRDDFEH